MKTIRYFSTISVSSAILIALVSAFIPSFIGCSDTPANGSPVASLDTKFNAKRSYDFLKEICDLGPRISGTEAMKKQQKRLEEHFTKLGGVVRRQEYKIKSPETGEPIPLTNMVVSWHPDKKERILLGAHYDTRPYADEDPDIQAARKLGGLIGANDGASGVAFFMEMAYHMSDLKGNYGVDFVLFDAEEYIFDKERDRGLLCYGSKHFAADYVMNPPKDYEYKLVVIVDMIADKNLQLYYETNSLRKKTSREAMYGIWKIAKDLKIKEFYRVEQHEVIDDHLSFIDQGIPAIDIIDFDYPHPSIPYEQQYWHTTKDIPENCSGESLAKVGTVLLKWLEVYKQ
ncbi:MAG: M28 family peptidase [Pirellulaceae bacterium]|nr:M28 family peptidase [Pirellulaceae bacterium]